MLLKTKKRYKVVQNVFSHKIESFLKVNAFVGEKEAVSLMKFDKSY